MREKIIWGALSKCYFSTYSSPLVNKVDYLFMKEEVEGKGGGGGAIVFGYNGYL